MPDYSYYRLSHTQYEQRRQKDPSIAQYLWHGEYDWEDEEEGDWILRIPNITATFMLRIELSDKITQDYEGNSAE